MLQIYLIQHFPGNKEKFLTSQQPCKFLSLLPLGCSSTSFFLSSESFTHYPWSLHSLIFYMLPGYLKFKNSLTKMFKYNLFFMAPCSWELISNTSSYKCQQLLLYFSFWHFCFPFQSHSLHHIYLIFLALWKQL